MKTIIAPDTKLNSTSTQSLLLVFDTVLSVAPISRKKALIESEYEKQGLRTFYTPSHLLEWSGKLSLLLADIKKHGEEFLANLLSLSASSKYSKDDERSASAIARLLAPSKNTENAADTDDMEKVLEAALLLELHAIQKEEEENVQAGLAAIGNKKKELYSLLRGEMAMEEDEDNDFGALFEVAAAKPEAPSFSRERTIRSWCRILAGEMAPGSEPMLTCCDEASFAYLNERYDKKFRKEPERLLSLRSPLSENLPEADFIILREEFRSKADKLLENLKNFFASAQSSSEDMSLAFDETSRLQEQWYHLAMEIFPAASSHNELIFYRFSGLSLPTLIHLGACSAPDFTDHKGSDNCIVACLVRHGRGNNLPINYDSDRTPFCL